MTRRIPASKLKAQCLALLDEVHKTRCEIVITKRGKPVAKLVPVASFFGGMKGTMKITGDIVSPIDDVWEAEHDDFALEARREERSAQTFGPEHPCPINMGY